MSFIAHKLSDILTDQLRVYFSNNEINATTSNDGRDIYFNQWLSLILIANSDFRILIKTYFNDSTVRELAPDALKIAQISDHQGLGDYMKELSNLFGGAVKRSLEASAISCGLSLPLIIYGFDELFAERLETADCAFIKLGRKGFEITVQVHFEFLNLQVKEILSKINFSVSKESSGGFEFL